MLWLLWVGQAHKVLEDLQGSSYCGPEGKEEAEEDGVHDLKKN